MDADHKDLWESFETFCAAGRGVRADLLTQSRHHWWPVWQTFRGGYYAALGVPCPDAGDPPAVPEAVGVGQKGRVPMYCKSKHG